MGLCRVLFVEGFAVLFELFEMSVLDVIVILIEAIGVVHFCPGVLLGGIRVIDLFGGDLGLLRRGIKLAIDGGLHEKGFTSKLKPVAV